MACPSSCAITFWRATCLRASFSGATKTSTGTWVHVLSMAPAQAAAVRRRSRLKSIFLECIVPPRVHALRVREDARGAWAKPGHFHCAIIPPSTAIVSIIQPSIRGNRLGDQCLHFEGFGTEVIQKLAG